MESEQTDYLSTRQALDTLMPLLRQTAGERRLDYAVEDAPLPVNKGTSLVVLLNELVSNAIKHGRGDICVELAVTEGIGCLEVADNGPGFPVGFDATASAHTGLELVDSLCRSDLQGHLEYENKPGGGGRVVVRFPLAAL
jgi:two-component sensor histidine kinase